MTSTSPTIKPRRVEFAYPTDTDRQYFVDGDMVSSHFFGTLSAYFPEGEDFFIRSVRAFGDQITDSELQDAVKGFISQEATHRHQHRLLNNRLDAMGYPASKQDNDTKRLFVAWEKVFSKKMCLAATAAMEHYTATLGEIVLTSDEMQRLLGENEIRSLLLWHAFEECEHKAVAFDVYRAVGGTERMRILIMAVTMLIMWPVIFGETFRSLAGDRAAYHPVRLLRSFKTLFKSPIFSRAAFRSYNSYYRPGFHPNDVDTTEMLADWSKELFDADGVQRRQASQ